jgi:hypothetical protein
MYSIVGIATGYGLGEPRIESPIGRDFLNYQDGNEVHYVSYKMGRPTGISPYVTKPRLDVDNPPYLAPRLKKE